MVSAWSIPKARRQSLSTTTKHNPGPGTYSPESTVRSHNQSMTNTPLSMYKTNPAYSFKKECQKKCEYTIATMKIGKDRRKGSNVSPGPGTGKYLAEKKFSFKNPPQYSFGLKAPDQLNMSLITPSPNTYKIDDSVVMRKTPMYSIGVSREQSPTDMFRKTTNNTPGPGKYEAPNTLNSTMGKSFTKEKRTVTHPDTPGPGTYQNKFIAYLENPPQFSFGNEKRTKTLESSTPAPGTYETDHSTMGKVGGLISKNGRCITENTYIPGPGQYNQDISPLKKKGENAIFGKSLRSTPTRNTSPAPNEYNVPQVDLYKKRFSNTIFGKSERPRISSIGNPGPGSYKEKLQWNTGIEFSMGQKFKDQIFALTPGPAHYEQNINPIKIQSQNITIGKSQRDSPDCRMYPSNHTPGPGNYQFNAPNIIKQEPKFSFTKARRGSKQSKSITPGPADYKIPPTFADVPKYLLNTSNN